MFCYETVCHFAAFLESEPQGLLGQLQPHKRGSNKESELCDNCFHENGWIKDFLVWCCMCACIQIWMRHTTNRGGDRVQRKQALRGWFTKIYSPSDFSSHEDCFGFNSLVFWNIYLWNVCFHLNVTVVNRVFNVIFTAIHNREISFQKRPLTPGISNLDYNPCWNSEVLVVEIFCEHHIVNYIHPQCI